MLESLESVLHVCRRVRSVDDIAELHQHLVKRRAALFGHGRSFRQGAMTDGGRPGKSCPSYSQWRRKGRSHPEDTEAPALPNEGGPTLPRQQLVKQISRALGRRRLYWFGTRGSDAVSLADIPQFSGSFTIIDTYRWDLDWAHSWEHFSNERVDLDEWDIDEHPEDPATHQLRSAMLTAMEYDHAIATYRPSDFLSDLTFARRDHCHYLGLFSGHQRSFEHKPFVESAIKAMDIEWLGWRYLAGRDKTTAARMLGDGGSIVLRPSRGSGGMGMRRIDSLEDLDALWPSEESAYISASHFRDNTIPLNIGGVVWDEGLTFHHPSVQLIGIPSCTSWVFGYCGNDFGLVKQLPNRVLDKIEHNTRLLADWLRTQGFRGAFGVDYLIDGDSVLFTEVNPRFQGSTRISAQYAARDGEPCLLVDHIAALLHLEPAKQPSLKELISSNPNGGHVVLHNTDREPVRLNGEKLIDTIRARLPHRQFDYEILCPSSASIDSGATLVAIQSSDALTTDGYHLDVMLDDTISTAVKQATTFASEGI